MIGRIPILDVQPSVDCGRWPAKAVVGETFTVSATAGKDDYLQSQFGIRDNNHQVYSGGVDWTPREHIAINASYQWRAVYPKTATEGLRASTSNLIVVRAT